MGLYKSRRNFGFGRSVAYAGREALRDRYGDGHYATAAAHAARWQQWAAWLAARGVRDVCEVTRAHIIAYAIGLQSAVEAGTMRVSYAQNLLCSVNVILAWMRRDRVLWISPSAAVGSRCTVRQTAPRWLDASALNAVRARLSGDIGQRVAAMVDVAQGCGARWKEAALFDARAALREALRHGAITLRRGTKGGQTRTVPCQSPRQLDALRAVAAMQGGADNLIPAGMSYRAFSSAARRAWLAAGGRLFRDLRAGYACMQYQAFTGCPAPVLGGDSPDAATDRVARAILSRNLGHHRPGVVAAYIGQDASSK